MDICKLKKEVEEEIEVFNTIASDIKKWAKEQDRKIEEENIKIESSFTSFASGLRFNTILLRYMDRTILKKELRKLDDLPEAKEAILNALGELSKCKC